MHSAILRQIYCDNNLNLLSLTYTHRQFEFNQTMWTPSFAFNERNFKIYNYKMVDTKFYFIKIYFFIRHTNEKKK